MLARTSPNEQENNIIKFLKMVNFIDFLNKKGVMNTYKF